MECTRTLILAWNHESLHWHIDDASNPSDVSACQCLWYENCVQVAPSAQPWLIIVIVIVETWKGGEL